MYGIWHRPIYIISFISEVFTVLTLGAKKFLGVINNKFFPFLKNFQIFNSSFLLEQLTNALK